MKISAWTFALAIVLFGFLRAVSADEADKLAAILVSGDDWKVAAEGLSFADGLSTDAAGNIYFCEMRAKPPTVWKMAPDGTKTKVGEGSRSGTRMGPDGKLYTVGTSQAAVYELSGGGAVVLAEKISTNDLAVSRQGFLYLTEPAKKQITLIDPKTREVRAVDTGIKSPNGIGLSPDQKTLYVSDAGGVNVFAFAVQPDGTLADKKPLMTMTAPDNRPTVASGDGLTVDTAGRVYVTSAMGLQIFAATGERLGVLPKPQPGSLISAAFGGKDLDILYVSCTDKIYSRKTKAKGALSFQEPTSSEKK
jgi:enterochelin esterase family protein